MRFETRAALKPERLKNEEDEEGAGKVFGDNNLRLQLGTLSARSRSVRKYYVSVYADVRYRDGTLV